jgi:GxxExxY protein
MYDAAREMSDFLMDGQSSLPSVDLTEKIIGCAFKVANTLGPGFLEKVYENALAHEIRKLGLVAEQQKRVDVTYDGIMVGYFDADIVVEGQVIIEVKAVRGLEDAHKAQTINYLKSYRAPARIAG